MNYSNITLKPPKDPTKEEVPIELENGELEARINLAILREPACGQCRNCVDKGHSRKLCEKRMEVRQQLIKTEKTKIYKNFKEDTMGGKKRKSETTSFRAPKKMKSLNGPKKKVPKMMKNSNGQLKPRVTSQGNKRMSIPDDKFPDFCRRIGANGTGERMKLINQFAEENPTVSVRQVTLRLGEITTREIPGCVTPREREKKVGRAFMFYLRPRFYKHLLPEDRPAGWEKYAEEDEKKWQQEKAKEEQAKANEKKAKAEKAKAAAATTTTTPSDDKSEISSNPATSVVDDDGEQTEEEGDPPLKKTKVSP